MSDVADRLESIRERVEAATEGPWRVEGFNPGRDGGEFRVRGVTQRAGYHRDEEKDRVVATAPVVPATHRDQAEANAHLIAASRSDVPWLLDKLTEMANAAHDLLSNLEHADEWGHEAAQPSLDQSRERLEQKIAALRDAAQEGEG